MQHWMRSQKLIFLKAIKQIAKNRICIVITHRVSNVPFYADKVMVIDEGKLWVSRLMIICLKIATFIMNFILQT